VPFKLWVNWTQVVQPRLETLDALPSSARSMSTFWSSVERPNTISRLVRRNSARLPCRTPRAPLAVAARAVAAAV
jgi:hypothetical protein